MKLVNNISAFVTATTVLAATCSHAVETYLPNLEVGLRWADKNPPSWSNKLSYLVKNDFFKFVEYKSTTVEITTKARKADGDITASGTARTQNGATSLSAAMSELSETADAEDNETTAAIVDSRSPLKIIEIFKNSANEMDLSWMNSYMPLEMDQIAPNGLDILAVMNELPTDCSLLPCESDWQRQVRAWRTMYEETERMLGSINIGFNTPRFGDVSADDIERMYQTLHYGFLDFDGDGTDELIISPFGARIHVGKDKQIDGPFDPIQILPLHFDVITGTLPASVSFIYKLNDKQEWKLSFQSSNIPVGRFVFGNDRYFVFGNRKYSEAVKVEDLMK